MKPSLSEDIIPVSDFRKKTTDYLKTISSKRRTLVLTQNGHSAAIVLSPEAFEELQYERELLLAIAQGEKEIAQGLGLPHEKVFKNLFRSLKAKPS